MKHILKSLYQNSKNKDIKESILKAFNANWYIRMYVAKNVKTPVHILEKLSNDENKYVCISIARNPSTPVSILEKLSKDKDYYVSYWVFRNPNWINRKG